MVRSVHVGREAILRPRLKSSLPLLEKYFSTVPFVLRSGLSLHCGGREAVSEYRMTLRAAKVPLESGSWRLVCTFNVCTSTD